MITLNTAPALEPVTIAQAKKQVRVDTDNVAAAIAGVTAGVAGAASFVVSGDRLSLLIEGETLTVSGSTGNDGSYTIRTGSTYSSGSDETTIPVAESVADATADGTLTIVDPLESELSGMITAARQLAEVRTHRAFIFQVWELHANGFPRGNGRIVFPKPNLISVDEIAYTDPAGDPQTLDASAYQVTTGAPGEVEPVPGTSWPETKDEPSSIVITFTAGYGAAAADVPAPIRHAIKLIIGDLYERREPRVDEKRSTLAALLEPYTIRNREMMEFV